MPPIMMPTICGLCKMPKTFKAQYNAQPNPTMGVKMIIEFLCVRCDLTPEPARPLNASS